MSGISSVILDHYGFGQREPIAAVDTQTGALAPTVNSRRLALLTAAGLYNPGTGAPEMLRTPSNFANSVTGVTLAAIQTLWTPAGGKRFRILAYRMGFTDNAAQAAGGSNGLLLTDGGSNIQGTRFRLFIPAAAGAIIGGHDTGWVVIPGNGYLSSAANNVLGLNLPTALTAGEAWAAVIGTEE